MWSFNKYPTYYTLFFICEPIGIWELFENNIPTDFLSIMSTQDVNIIKPFFLLVFSHWGVDSWWFEIINKKNYDG